MKFTCKICSKHFRSKSDVKRHVQTIHHNTLTSKCSVCEKTFSRRDGLLRHMKLVHAADGTKKGQSRLDRDHPSSYPSEMEFTCNICSKHFRSKSDVKQHIMTIHHNNTLRFKCSVCEKTFSRRDGLVRHMNRVNAADGTKKECGSSNKPNQNQIETKEGQRFQCTLCPKYFVRKRSIRRHMERMHENNCPWFDCNECGEKFKDEYHLSSHLAIGHDSLKASSKDINTPEYECSECEKMFKTMDSMISHFQKMHDDQAEFECNYCGILKKSKYGMKLHIWTLHFNHPPDDCIKSGLNILYESQVPDRNHKSSDFDSRPPSPSIVYAEETVNCNSNPPVPVIEDLLPHQDALSASHGKSGDCSPSIPPRLQMPSLILECTSEAPQLQKTLNENTSIHSKEDSKSIISMEYHTNEEGEIQQSYDIKREEDNKELNLNLIYVKQESIEIETTNNVYKIKMEEISTEDESSSKQVKLENCSEEGNSQISLSNRQSTLKNDWAEKISKVRSTEENVLQDQNLTVENENYQIPNNYINHNDTLLFNTQKTDDNPEYSNFLEKNIIISPVGKKAQFNKPPQNSALSCMCFKCRREGSNRHPCDICGKIYNDSKGLANHKERKCCILMPYSCKICNKAFCHKKSLALHEEHVHTDVKEEHKCKLCNKIYNNKYSLYIHSKGCKTKPFFVETPQTCSICQKTLGSKDSLQRHMRRSHDPSKQFICSYCNKVFHYKELLAYHIQSHLSIRFECEICSKSYITQSSLDFHNLKYHTDENDKSFICETCGKQFAMKHSLTKHLVRHSDEKRFVCEVCGKSFKTDSNLIQHTVTHSDKRPFGCTLCDKAFRIRNHLKQHMAAHGKVNTLNQEETVNLNRFNIFSTVR